MTHCLTQTHSLTSSLNHLFIHSLHVELKNLVVWYVTSLDEEKYWLAHLLTCSLLLQVYENLDKFGNICAKTLKFGIFIYSFNYI